MSISAIEEIQQNSHALGAAHAVALADQAVERRGGILADHFVHIHEEGEPPARVWRVYYIPRNYREQRGGGFEVAVDEQSGQVTKLLLGQ
jgi:hypothetical protein